MNSIDCRKLLTPIALTISLIACTESTDSVSNSPSNQSAGQTSVGASSLAASTSSMTNTFMNAGTEIMASGSRILNSLTGNTPAAPLRIEKARCSPRSMPENGLQGQVSAADRESGRSQLGYSCNLELVGQYQGEGASWVNPFYKNCAYMATSFGGIPGKKSQGVQVVDMTDTSKPRFSTNLTSPAMFAGTWESLKVNEARGLLGGVAVGPVLAGAFFDVYDLNADCTKPTLANSFSGNLTLPANVLGHEGNWAPDGLTYWASGLAGGSLTAIDVTDTKSPKIVFTGTSVISNHGFEISEDGNRMYLSTVFPAGLIILDISEVQSRKPLPMIKQLGSVFWNTAGASQHTIPVTFNQKKHLIAVDEFAGESIKFIDISDELNPKIVSRLQLEIHLPQHATTRLEDTTGNGLFGYEAHYCSVDRKNEPTAMACGFLQSGIRVFDIRNPEQVKEVAYFNPPAQVGKQALLKSSEHTSLLVNNLGGVPGSEAGNLTGNSLATILTGSLTNPSAGANLTADYCSSPPKFVGRNELWVTCQDNGVLALKFTNGTFPLN